MPHSLSAKKRLRQNLASAQANKSVRTAMRSAEKRIQAQLAAGDKAAAAALLPEVYQRLDKAARRHVIHANTAANHKRRLARAVARLG